MSKLWDKGYELDKFIEYFETKDDLELDQKLVRYDVLGSIAHAKMLEKIGILTAKELQDLKKGLKEIIELDKKGDFQLKFGDEDIHTKIENYLTEKYGEAGKKIHTGRSRNDQVLTAVRLFTKHELAEIWKNLLNLSVSFLNFAEKYEFIFLPGYTHMQRAMPSSIGMWAGNFVESLLDDISQLKVSYNLNDQSPLGSGPGYGIPLDIDRELTSSLLNFNKVQNNPIYCQNSRGKIEAVVLSSLISILYTLNKFAADTILFTTSEFNFFEVAENLCTGSSAMPQKKNVDIAELLQSKIHLVLGNYIKVISIPINQASGYHRDLQDTKNPLFESLEITKDSLKVADILINNLKPKEEILTKSMSAELFATQAAYLLVKKGMSFREAYKKIANELNSLKANEFKEVINGSRHLGGLGNLGLNKIEKQIIKEKEIWQKEMNKFEKTIKNLTQ